MTVNIMNPRTFSLFTRYTISTLYYRNILVEEKPVEPEPEEEKSTTPDAREKDHTTPTKSRKSEKLDSKKDRVRRSSAKSRTGRRSSMVASPPPGEQTPASETDTR